MAKLVSTKTELAAIRGMCARDKKISSKVLAGTDESYFYNPKSIDAYRRIRRIILEEGEAPIWRDFIEDPSLSEDTREYLKMNRARFYDVDDAVSCLKVLNKYRKARGLWNLGEAIVEKLQEKKVDVDNLLDGTTEAITKLRMERSIKDQVLHIGRGNNSYEFVKNLLYNREDNPFMPTKFRDFDDKNGGFFWGSLVTIAGTTGGGKSALASQLAINFASLGENVCIVPLEMAKREMTGRILASLADIDVRKILLQRLTEDEKELVMKKYKKYVKKVHGKEGRYTIFKPEQDMSAEEILPIASSYGARIVIIDYISLLKGVGGDDQWQKLSDVARYCKIWASNNNKIVVLLAQLSEDGKIRYSRAIAEHSDYAWVFVSNKETRENEILNIEQLKGRNVELFPFSLRATMNTMRIGDLSEEELEEMKSKNKSKDKRGDKKSKKEDTEQDYIDDIANEE